MTDATPKITQNSAANGHSENEPDAKVKTDQAKKDVANAATAAKSAATAAKSAVSTTASAIGSDVQSAARETVDNLKVVAREEAENRKGRAATSLSRVAQEIRGTARNCDQQDPWAGMIMTAGASSLEAVADRLHSDSIGDLIGEAEKVARDNPAAFLGASVAAGFLLARIGKTATARAFAGQSFDQTHDQAQSSYQNGAYANGNYAQQYPISDEPETEK